MKKTLSLGVAALLAITSLAACGDSDSSKTESSSGKVEVTGDVGSKPKVTVDAPLKLSKSSSEVLHEGDGETVKDKQPYILQLTLVDGRTGKTVISTYDKGQKALGITAGAGQIFPIVEKEAVGKKAGTRILVQAAPKDAYGSTGNTTLGVKKDTPMVMVADVIAARAKDELKGPDGGKAGKTAGAPGIVLKGDTPTGITVSGAKPKKTKVYPIIKGTGEKVTPAKVVTVNYYGAVWGRKKSFDGSYARGEATAFPVGIGGVIPCWDEGLEGVKVGSRVLISCPADQAYGAKGSPPNIPPNATLNFVIDVLAVG